jgi:hypothetical protein
VLDSFGDVLLELIFYSCAAQEGELLLQLIVEIVEPLLLALVECKSDLIKSLKPLVVDSFIDLALSNYHHSESFACEIVNLVVNVSQFFRRQSTDTREHYRFGSFTQKEYVLIIPLADNDRHALSLCIERKLL